MKSRSHTFDDDEVELWTYRQGGNDSVHVWSDAAEKVPAEPARVVSADSESSGSRKGEREGEGDRRSFAFESAPDNNGIVVVRELRIT